jgi:plastocyanin
MKFFGHLVGLVAVISALSANAADFGVRIGTYFFNPANVVIRPGDRVVWTNTSDRTHDTTSATNLWRSGNISRFSPNNIYAFTFTNIGYYPYRCIQHSSQPQTGTVSVVNISLASVTTTETNTQFDVRGGRQGLRAVVEAGGTLTAFAPIATNVFPAAGTLRFTNNAPPGTNRFYRTRVIP